jgi:hypothetical protein
MAKGKGFMAFLSPWLSAQREHSGHQKTTLSHCFTGGGCFTQLLRSLSWLHVKSFIANFVIVVSRVVVCHVKLSRVNSRRIKIRVDLRRVNIRRKSQFYCSQNRTKQD